MFPQTISIFAPSFIMQERSRPQARTFLFFSAPTQSPLWTIQAD